MPSFVKHEELAGRTLLQGLNRRGESAVFLEGLGGKRVKEAGEWLALQEGPRLRQPIPEIA